MATETVNVIVGDGGKNTINGTGGSDFIVGGGNSDTINAGGGNDVVIGDRYNFAKGTLAGGSFGDDSLRGGGGDDFLFGGRGNDFLSGGNGMDVLDGGADNDTLIGGAGDDLLLGGDGDDLLSGGRGEDVLVGGSGKDTFQFLKNSFSTTEIDFVVDFQQGVDKLSIEGFKFGVSTIAWDANSNVATFDGKLSVAFTNLVNFTAADFA